VTTTVGPQAFRRSGNFATRRIGGETIVVPIRSQAAELDSVFVLNEVGAALWGWLEVERSADDLIRHVAEGFDTTPDTAREDVERFLGQLTEAGLVEKAATP
jgi:hypothetical protein